MKASYKAKYEKLAKENRTLKRKRKLQGRLICHGTVFGCEGEHPCPKKVPFFHKEEIKEENEAVKEKKVDVTSEKDIEELVNELLGNTS